MPAVSQVDLVRGGACGAVGNRSEISRGKAHVQIRTVRAPGAIDRCGVVVQRVVYVRTIRNRVRGAAAGVLVRPHPRTIHRPRIVQDNQDIWRKRSEEHTSELPSLMRISYAVY